MYLTWTTENEVDGDGFLVLNVEQIKQIVPKVGPQAKLLKKHAKVLATMVWHLEMPTNNT